MGEREKRRKTKEEEKKKKVHIWNISFVWNISFGIESMEPMSHP